MVNAQDVSRFTDRSRITKGSSILLFSSLSLRGWNGGRRRSPYKRCRRRRRKSNMSFISDEGRNELVICQAKRWKCKLRDGHSRCGPSFSSPLLLPPSNFSTPYFSRFSTSRPFITQSSWHETSPNEISQKTKRNILMDRRRRRQFSRRSCMGVGRYCREVCWVWNTRLKGQDFHCVRYKFPAYCENKGRVRAILRGS